MSPSFKENVYGKYQEKKDHIVAKLGNLTNSQKRILIGHLDQSPHKESMIDWNNKDLKWEDFAEMLATTSKTQKKALVKKEGLGGLEEGKEASYTIQKKKETINLIGSGQELIALGVLQ